MKTISTALLAMLLLTINLKAQTKIRVSDFSIQGGAFTANTENNSSNINLPSLAFANHSTLLSNFNATNFNSNGNYINKNTGMFSLLLGTEIIFPSKVKMNVRMGVTTLGGMSINNYFSKTDNYVIDTLTSSQTGQQYVVDSLRTDSYIFNTANNQIAFDIAATFSTNKLHKFSFYSGIGLLYGVCYNNQLNVNHSNFAGYNSYYYPSNYHPNYNQDYLYKSETIQLKNDGSTFAIYCPIGVNYRLSKKIVVLKNIDYFIEMRPSFVKANYSDMNYQRTYTDIAVLQGLRYNIGRK